MRVLAQFVTAATDPNQFPAPSLPEVAFIVCARCQLHGDAAVPGQDGGGKGRRGAEGVAEEVADDGRLALLLPGCR